VIEVATAEHLQELGVSEQLTEVVLTSGWPTYAALVDGVAVAVGGVIPFNDYRCHGWAQLSIEALKYFKSIHKAVLNFLANFEVQRIEATCLTDHDSGHRWLRHLGFSMEAPRMTAYDASGRDFSLYARVRRESH
jgi:RimJ/RimL family protein N-acetyltransferase